MPLFAYIGKYANEYIGNIQILETNGTLVMQPDVPSSENFEIGSKQKAIRVTIDDLNEVGLGSPTKVSEPE